MSLSPADELFDGRVGHIDEHGIRYFTRVFQVFSDVIDVAPNAVAAAPGVPGLYSVCPYDSGCVVKNIETKQDGGGSGTPYRFYITVQYDSAPLRTSSSPDKANDFQQKPDLRPVTIAYASHKGQKVLALDWNAYNHQSDPDAMNRPLVNSANCPFDPPVEVPASNPTIRITAYRSNFDDSKIARYTDAINNAAFLGKQARSLKCTEYNAVPQQDNNTFYYQIDVTLEVRLPELWNPLKVLDAGCYEVSTIGGAQRLVQITDPYGQPVHTPVPLDGNGHALAPGNPLVYLSFDAYREEDFSKLI